MKKKWYVIGLAAAFSAAAALSAFAGQWVQDGNRAANAGGISNWWYRNDDSSYPAGRWDWIDGNNDGTAECYYFDGSGWMYASTDTPDGFRVNENGAWVVDGVIQTKPVENNSAAGRSNAAGQNSAATQNNTTAQTSGWKKVDGGWMYYTSKDHYATGWKKIDKKKYYFDETGYMLTGYQELKDGSYYFYDNGQMADKNVHIDGLYYVIESDGQIVDEVAEEDWTDYRRDNDISASADDIKNKTYDRDDGINEEMALDFLDLVNAEREKKNREPLEINDALMEAAQIRAQELVEKYSHTRPDGTSCNTVFEEVGITDYSSEGENIAVGQGTPYQVVTDWMNSSGHKKNILNSGYTETGVACYIESGSRYRVHWVQLFYTP